MPFAKILREEETLNIWESEKEKKKKAVCFNDDTEGYNSDKI